MTTAFHCTSAFRGFVQLHGINPSDRGGHHAEVEMVDHGLGIPALGLSASGEQGDPSGFSKDPDDAHRALEGLEHDHPLEGHYLAGPAVEVDIV